MEDNKNMVSSTETEQTGSTTENVEVETSEVKKEPEKVFTRDEVNKMINAEKLKERQAVMQEFAAKQAEADRLAKMDEEQKRNYEFEQLTSRAEKAERELNAFRLKEETTRQASERGITLAYLDTIDFSRETAESINQKLDIFERTSKVDRERAISEYSKEPAPRTGDSPAQKTLSELKTYEEIREYYEKHPEAK